MRRTARQNIIAKPRDMGVPGFAPLNRRTAATAKNMTSTTTIAIARRAGVTILSLCERLVACDLGRAKAIDPITTGFCVLMTSLTRMRARHETFVNLSYAEAGLEHDLMRTFHFKQPVGARVLDAASRISVGPFVRFVEARQSAEIVRDLRGLPSLLERCGPFEIRLATTKRDIRRIQKLRFKVFYGEGNAISDLRSSTTRRDICAFDRICDHLFIVDTQARDKNGAPKRRIVGTYRLLRGDVAAANHGFYSQSEFDLAPLLSRHPDKAFLELGRSCVHADYRSKRVIELLWRGLWLYAVHHDVDALIGCASLPGVDLREHAKTLSFLHHYACASSEWSVQPCAGRGVAMDMIEKSEIVPRLALVKLPPLIKAYMRVGARFGAGAVVDHQFGTTDVFTIMPMRDIAERYQAHFGQAQGDVSAPVS